MKTQRNKLLNDLEKKIGSNFKNQKLLEQVFVHRSYLNEHPAFRLGNNERLEFLGDAVLELIVTDHLYKNFPEPEGELTSFRSALVKGRNLAQIAKKLGLSNLLLLSRGEEKNQGRDNELILANTFEALVGAIYLDLGLEKTRDFIKNWVLSKLDEILQKGMYRDAKSQLQELYQAKKGLTPVYKVLKQSGPDHAKKFVIGVYVGKKKLAEGQGSSKQKAQSNAAKQALKKL